MRSCGMSGVQGRGIASVANLVHEAGRLPDGPRARTLQARGGARRTGDLPAPAGYPERRRVDRLPAPCDNLRMTRGRHALALPLVLTFGLALAGVLLATCMVLPAAASAAGSSSGARQPAGGPVDPAPALLKDVMGRGAGVAAPQLPLGLGALPGARETAAFAAGRVAVAVVFLESDGSKMTSSENWSSEDPSRPGQDRRQLVLDKVRNALEWWNARSPDGSLDVFMPPAGSYGAPQTVKTGYEPIRMPIKVGWQGRPVLSDAAWRWQVMAGMGFGHDTAFDSPKPETAFADKVRRRNNADWAFVLYVVDSLNDRDGSFSNGAIAYTADLFGPYSTLTYDNQLYHFTHFDAVLAHEMGHIFGALDEYQPPAAGYPSTGDLTAGYLGVRNRNAVIGGTTDYPCIMRGSDDTLSAFPRGQLCPSTIGQTGLRDGDSDTHPDVVDTKPAFSTRLETTAADGAVTLRGTVTEQPRKRGVISGGVYFRHDLSIRVPHALRYRVDGADWQPLTATDGTFGEPQEGWTLTTGPLTTGHHVLELEGTTGETAGRTRDLWAGPTPVDLELATDAAFTKSTATVKAGVAVTVYVRSSSAGLPVPRLTPVRLVRLADGKVMATLATGENGVWTGTLKPAHTRTYEVRFAGAGQFQGPAASDAVTITVR